MRRVMMALVAVPVLAFGLTAEAAGATARKKPAAKPAPTRHHVAPAPAAAKKSPAAVKKGPVASKQAPSQAIRSASALVQDQTTGKCLYEKNAGAVVPIASITKLMTAMVALEAAPDLAETLTITDADVDTLKGSSSRLPVGTQLSREEMLRLALMSSDNRAAAALSRNYPGGRPAFIAAMNSKAQALGLADTRFCDPTGLTAANVASARDLAKMVAAACEFPLIREYTTTAERTVTVKGRPRLFRNTNPLVRNPTWSIGLSKTGYISEAGRCLVMQARLNNKPTIIVLLDSWGRLTRVGDANRIRRMLEGGTARPRVHAG